MGRGRRKVAGGIRNVFDYNSETNKSTCKICDEIIPGDHLNNLRKHLSKKHPEVYETLDRSEDDGGEEEPPAKKRKISVEYDPSAVEKAWLDLIVKEGRPFVMLDSEALRTLLKPVFDELEITMLTSHNVAIAIADRADEIVGAITKELSNKLFSLKIDSASRHGRRVICINAQRIVKAKIKIYTLAMAEMNVADGRHTAKNIKLFVLYVLNR